MLTERFQLRRKRLMQQMGSGVALIGSPGRSPDKMLWDKNLCYLTGLEDKNVYLLLAPDGVMVERFETLSEPELGRGRRVHEILFVEEKSAQDVLMDGPSSSFEDIQRATGVDRVYSLAKQDEILEMTLLATDTVWLNTPHVPVLNHPLTNDLRFANRIRDRFCWIHLKNIATMIHQMRFVKDAYEISSLRLAFEIQAEIFEKIMRALKPGKNESLGQAIFDYEVTIRSDQQVRSMRSDLYAASIIVGAGKNSAIPHYMANNQIIRGGDLVLIDSGVSVNGYSSDITRTFPANGRYTPRQHELYTIVLEAEQAAIATMKPGSTMLDGSAPGRSRGIQAL